MQRIASIAHRRFLRDTALAAGMNVAEADMVAEAMLWADLRERTEYGLIRLPNVVARVRRGLMPSPARMQWTEVAPSAWQLDAGDASGFVAGTLAMRRAVETAKTQGVGVVTVRRSVHYGAAAYYCDIAAEADCIGLTCTNAVPKVAAFNGTRPVLGTNPLAFGCPTAGRHPVLVDMAFSSIAGSTVRAVERNESLLPPDAALDAQGHPTRDPVAAAAGALLPAAGAKGYALALMVEILSGVLSGAAVGPQVGSVLHTWDQPIDAGHFFLAIDISRFMPMDDFFSRLAGLMKWIKSSPSADPDIPVRIPGEARAEHARRNAEEGLQYTPAMIRSANALVDEFHVPPPWNPAELKSIHDKTVGRAEAP